MHFTHTYNEILRQTIVDNYELYKVNSHNCRCSLCGPFEGKILNREQLDNAKMNGLFHPNCTHYLMEVV
mgnify:CR=1 FL=1